MDKNVNYSKILKDAQSVLKNLPREILEQRPDLLKIGQDITEAVKNGDSTKLNEFIKQNASNIK